MIISYPILPANAVNQSEEDRFNAMLALAQNDRGLYPVTTGNRWHGGIHLTPGAEPIRAIADGVIVAYRLAPDSRDYPGQGAYDTSFVLIKHETESGENTKVVFYSLYMHLKPKGLLTEAQRNQLAPFLRDAAVSDGAVQAPAKTRIWRKEVLGFGGQLYGQPTVHFEIFATEADFNVFWRDRNIVAPGQHGSDDVFGDTHFVIQTNLQFAERHPRAIAPHRIDLPGKNAFYDLDLGQAGQNIEPLHIVVELSKGTRTATTYRLDDYGQVTDRIGDPVVQQDYEYELYRLATALYPDCPSAGFEYLRFGRILGPDTTTRNENWQLVRYSDAAMGYIDLAAAAHQVSVLSDADFPLRWQKLEEGATASPSDGMANIGQLSQLLQLPAAPSEPTLSAPAGFTAQAAAENAAKALRHFICKHPSEWDASNLEQRYAVLRQPARPLHGDAPWKNFKDHVEAMAFWSQSGLASASVWHFNPLQFIHHYKKCIWLSQQEFAQCMPRRSLGDGNLGWQTAMSRAADNHRSYNKFIRKYCGISKQRYAHNLIQSFEETGIFRLKREGGLGRAKTYGAFYGRGFHQLTWVDNYIKYGEFRNLGQHNAAYSDERITRTSTHTSSAGSQVTWFPRYDPDRVADDYEAGDSSGFFWVSKSFRGKKNINRAADLHFNTTTTAFICWLINGGSNGYERRMQYSQYISNVLLDLPLATGSVTFTFPVLATVTGSFPPPQVALPNRETVHHDPQRP